MISTTAARLPTPSACMASPLQIFSMCAGQLREEWPAVLMNISLDKQAVSPKVGISHELSHLLIKLELTTFNHLNKTLFQLIGASPRLTIADDKVVNLHDGDNLPGG